MEINQAVQALGALAQETRLTVFRLLVQAGAEGLAVGKIAEGLGIAANGRLTFHLKELVNAGLVHSQTQGRFVYYRANYTGMNALLAYLTENCCGGGNCKEYVDACQPSPSDMAFSENSKD